MTFSISALVWARDSHIKPDSEVGGLIWVEGWYQGRYGKFHVIIFLSHILHWPFPSIDFYIAKIWKKIFERTNCENKSLRELPLFYLQIFLLRVWFQKYTKQCRSVQFLFNTTPIWANYSVSSYLNFIPICWNVLIWLKYDFIPIFMHHLSLYFQTTVQIPGKYGYWGQIRIFSRIDGK